MKMKMKMKMEKIEHPPWQKIVNLVRIVKYGLVVGILLIFLPLSDYPATKGSTPTSSLSAMGTISSLGCRSGSNGRASRFEGSSFAPSWKRRPKLLLVPASDDEMDVRCSIEEKNQRSGWQRTVS